MAPRLVLTYGAWLWKSWVLTPTLPLTSCVALDKPLPLSWKSYPALSYCAYLRPSWTPLRRMWPWGSCRFDWRLPTVLHPSLYPHSLPRDLAAPPSKKVDPAPTPPWIWAGLVTCFGQEDVAEVTVCGFQVQPSIGLCASALSLSTGRLPHELTRASLLEGERAEASHPRPAHNQVVPHVRVSSLHQQSYPTAADHKWDEMSACEPVESWVIMNDCFKPSGFAWSGLLDSNG